MKLEQHDLDWIEKMLLQETGNVFTQARSQLLFGKLKQATVLTKHEDVAHLIEALRHEKNSSLREQVISCLLNYETMFFRDNVPFTFLKEVALPNLYATRQKEKTITIWSAGCSYGQEPYSLVMLLQKSFPLLADWNIQVLASDVSSMALDRARSGLYSYVEVHRGLEEDDRRHFFRQQEEQFQIKKVVREKVEFFQFALNKTWPSWPVCDIVFLRNVLLYCSLSMKQQILNQVKKILRPGSYLVLGNAEFLPWQETSFVRCKKIGSMYCYLQEQSHQAGKRMREEYP